MFSKFSNLQLLQNRVQIEIVNFAFRKVIRSIACYFAGTQKYSEKLQFQYFNFELSMELECCNAHDLLEITNSSEHGKS